MKPEYQDKDKQCAAGVSRNNNKHIKKKKKSKNIVSVIFTSSCISYKAQCLSTIKGQPCEDVQMQDGQSLASKTQGEGNGHAKSHHGEPQLGH